jgi:iron complex outermembrane recepter protein
MTAQLLRQVGRAALITAGIGAAVPAIAQSAAPQPAAGAAPEIVVTAQKRKERAQDIPATITAISADTLAKRHVTEASDIVSLVPNLHSTNTTGDSTPLFSLRGISMSDYSLNQDGPIATYYDEVYKGNPALLGLGFFDLDHLEVLSGPQGTLYGKNTTGGAVNLISRAPTFDTNGYATVGYGNYNAFTGTAAFNTALTKTLALRVAVTGDVADGWYKNVTPGQPDFDSKRDWGVRASLLYKPNSQFSALLRVQETFQDPYNYGIYAQPGPGGEGVGVYSDPSLVYQRPASLGNWQTQSYNDGRRRNLTQSASLTLNYDFDNGLALTSITSYDYGDLIIPEHTSGAPNNSIAIWYYDTAKQFTQDLRLTTKWSKPWNFILGAYYNREMVWNANRFQMFTDLAPVSDASCVANAYSADCVVENQFDQLKHSYALYSDGNWKIGPLTLRGGLRYTWDDGKQYNFNSIVYGPSGAALYNNIPGTGTSDINATVAQSFSTSRLTGKLGLDYAVNRDIRFYGTWSTGYRGNSFNAQAFFLPAEFNQARPETISAFEIGEKGQFFNRHLTVNLAAFHYRYHDQQFISVNPTTAAQTLVNLDRSHITGAEAQMTWWVNDRLSFHTNLGWLDAKVDSGVVDGLDVSGNQLINAPHFSFDGGFDWTVLEGNFGAISLHPALSHVSSQFFDIHNKPFLNQNGYEMFDGHIDWVSPDKAWTLSVWGKNIGNRFYFTSRYDLETGSAFNFIYNHIGAPRTYGFTLTRKF